MKFVNWEKCEAVANVYKTNDYGIFKYLLGNRSVKPKRVKKIIESINKVGYVVPSPVIVNEKMEVIDGQGRIEACKEKGLPVYFVIAENAGVEECTMMNIGQSNWSINDYVESYASRGNDNYIRLQKITEEYPQFTVAEIYGVCTNSITVNGFASLVIKGGDLELSTNDYARIVRVLDFLVEMESVLDAIPGSSRVKRTGLAWVIENTNCDRKRLREKLSAEYPKLSPVVETMPTLYLSELSDIYNKRLTGKNCLYFDAMYKQSLRS